LHFVILPTVITNEIKLSNFGTNGLLTINITLPVGDVANLTINYKIITFNETLFIKELNSSLVSQTFEIADLYPGTYVQATVSALINNNKSEAQLEYWTGKEHIS
jgi:hypothetical protein